MTPAMDKYLMWINWGAVLRNAKIGGAVLFAFAAGGWFTSIRVEEARLPYLKRETAQQEQLKKVAGQDPLAAIQCQTRRADIAAKIADQSVAISNFSVVNEKILNRIPDCPRPGTGSVPY